MAIDTMLRAFDLLRLRVSDVCTRAHRGRTATMNDLTGPYEMKF